MSTPNATASINWVACRKITIGGTPSVALDLPDYTLEDARLLFERAPDWVLVPKLSLRRDEAPFRGPWLGEILETWFYDPNQDPLRSYDSSFHHSLGGGWPFDEVKNALELPDGDIAPSGDAVGTAVLSSLEKAFRKMLPNIGVTSIAGWWRSWEVQNLVSQLVVRVVRRQESATRGSDSVGALAKEALQFAIRAIESYTHGLMHGGLETVRSHARSPRTSELQEAQGPDTGAAAKVTGTTATTEDGDANDDEPVSRRPAVDSYIDEVFRATGKRITKTIIWKGFGYKTRTEFERWQRDDPRATKIAHARFNSVLTQKPHLK